MKIIHTLPEVTKYCCTQMKNHWGCCIQTSFLCGGYRCWIADPNTKYLEAGPIISFCPFCGEAIDIDVKNN